MTVSFSILNGITTATFSDGGNGPLGNGITGDITTLLNNATAVVIDNSFTSIANNAFSEATNLTSITLPTTLTTIGAKAFLHLLTFKTPIFCDKQTV